MNAFPLWPWGLKQHNSSISGPISRPNESMWISEGCWRWSRYRSEYLSLWQDPLIGWRVISCRWGANWSSSKPGLPEPEVMWKAWICRHLGYYARSRTAHNRIHFVEEVIWTSTYSRNPILWSRHKSHVSWIKFWEIRCVDVIFSIYVPSSTRCVRLWTD